MHMSDFATLPFIRALQQHGAHVYTVGGTVRDLLLGHPRKDVDLLVTGMPQDALIRLLRRHGRVQLTGRAFGVIKFLPRHWDDSPIDIALPRTEVSTGVGHRDFVVTFDHTLPVETDLGRRDFTINAMAMDLADGRLLDPFGGRMDLQQRRLRQVSQAAFPEDPLRMLRGVQLATRFDLRVETTTYQAMQAQAASITTVAPERIAEELRKLFQATAPSGGFVLMQEVELLPYVFPEIARLVGFTGTAAVPLHGNPTPATYAPDIFMRTIRRLDAMQQQEAIMHRGHLDLLLAALFQHSGLSEAVQLSPQALAQHSADLASQRLRALRMTTIGAHVDRIVTLIVYSTLDISTLDTTAALRHLAHRLGLGTTFMLFDLWLADRLGSLPPHPIDDLLACRQRLQDELARHVPLSLQDLAVNGHDLQRLGIPPGPRLGQILQTLLQHVLDDPTQNTRDHLLSMAQSEVAHTVTEGGMQNAECGI
jgi:poly(A) polymerase/tRNA nucleotidyltransferase (CCA-adding enzyme)